MRPASTTSSTMAPVAARRTALYGDCAKARCGTTELAVPHGQPRRRVRADEVIGSSQPRAEPAARRCQVFFLGFGPADANGVRASGILAGATEADFQPPDDGGLAAVDPGAQRLLLMSATGLPDGLWYRDPPPPRWWTRRARFGYGVLILGIGWAGTRWATIPRRLPATSSPDALAHRLGGDGLAAWPGVAIRGQGARSGRRYAATVWHPFCQSWRSPRSAEPRGGSVAALASTVAQPSSGPSPKRRPRSGRPLSALAVTRTPQPDDASQRRWPAVAATIGKASPDPPTASRHRAPRHHHRHGASCAVGELRRDLACGPPPRRDPRRHPHLLHPSCVRSHPPSPGPRGSRETATAHRCRVLRRHRDPRPHRTPRRRHLRRSIHPRLGRRGSGRLPPRHGIHVSSPPPGPCRHRTARRRHRAPGRIRHPAPCSPGRTPPHRCVATDPLLAPPRGFSPPSSAASPRRARHEQIAVAQDALTSSPRGLTGSGDLDRRLPGATTMRAGSSATVGFAADPWPSDADPDLGRGCSSSAGHRGSGARVQLRVGVVARREA